MSTPSEFAYGAAIIDAFRANKRLADRAVEQIPDDKLHLPLDENTNSIAVIMKHVAGNLISRWTDFLTSDGEKHTRNRDSEFIDAFTNRKEVLEYWERGWSCLFSKLEGLSGEDYSKAVHIHESALHWTETGLTANSISWIGRSRYPDADRPFIRS